MTSLLVGLPSRLLLQHADVGPLARCVVMPLHSHATGRLGADALTVAQCGDGPSVCIARPLHAGLSRAVASSCVEKKAKGFREKLELCFEFRKEKLLGAQESLRDCLAAATHRS